MTSAHGALDFEGSGGGVDVEDAVWTVGFTGEDGGEGVEYGEVLSPKRDGVEG